MCPEKNNDTLPWSVAERIELSSLKQEVNLQERLKVERGALPLPSRPSQGSTDRPPLVLWGSSQQQALEIQSYSQDFRRQNCVCCLKVLIDALFELFGDANRKVRQVDPVAVCVHTVSSVL
ncbi:hypothetical protein AVEN_161825-1 [Araneus ventricosus]|uniref:Uncharacterized protein n=1 Tax=Araneus ventricosus TaxID=182803 RepID=A0A4Y2FUJ4_ARAVE|nr:hypothetical protein AVEN_161825-1 [Araneus ventricosus]